MSVNCNGYSIDIVIERHEIHEIAKVLRSKGLDWNVLASVVTITPIYDEEEAKELDTYLNDMLTGMRVFSKLTEEQ